MDSKRIKNIRIGIENALKWSLYKHKIFKNCNRKFLFKYLDFFVLKEEKVLVSFLKKIKFLKHFQGDLVHLFIKIIINNFINNNSIDFEEIKNKFKIQFWNNINNSKKITCNNFGNLFDANFINLYKNNYIWEFFYDYSITNKELENLYEMSLTALVNFYQYFNDNILKALKNFHILWIDSIGEIKNKDNVNKKYNIIEYNLKIENGNIKILLNPDFVIINEKEKQIFIYDWKTHKKEDLDLNQFKLYTLYYSNIYNEFNIKNIIVYLFPELEEQVISINDIQDFIEFIFNSYNEIKNKIKEAYLELKNHTDINDENIKKIYEYFPVVDDLSTCSFCEFRKLCFNL